ncbi:MAG: selenide, water dikinase SelD [Acidimicrobiia bacterium]|nr:selenide, water dikinase SelD [Acidimicrobiia bacterium]
MRSLPTPTHQSLYKNLHRNLVVGTETGDDAAVWCLDNGQKDGLEDAQGAPCVVSTADFFAPVVDDPHTWGRIAAANAVSDIYAMGGTPLFGLNLVAWPQTKLPLDLLTDVLAGGAAVAEKGGWAIAGGHTINGPEPLYGQAITGQVDPAKILTNSGGQPGQWLVLTKPIGTGLVATAIKQSEPEACKPNGSLAESYRAAVTEMTRLNDKAAATALEVQATAATDITGFGLLGHLQKMAEASQTGAVIQAEQVPVLTGAWELLDQGFIAGGSTRNLQHIQAHIQGCPDQRVLTMLTDAQTSGGLLFSCDPSAATEAVARLQAQDHTAAIIGELTAQRPAKLTITQ